MTKLPHLFVNRFIRTMSLYLRTVFLLSLSAVLAKTGTFTYEPAVNNEQFPWFCTVYDNADFKPVCYCTILGKNAIVTAAKCFEKRDIKNTNEPKYHVRFGSIAANGMRKVVNVKEIVTSGSQHLAMLRPKPLIEGYHTIELAESKYTEPKDNKITIATFHSYGTRNPMKTHVHLVNTTISKDTKNCEFAFAQHHFCAVESKQRCNIGLGTGAVSVSTKNSSRWILHGVVAKSPKCGDLDKNSKLADIFVKINEEKWNWIKHNLN